jgi:hypothetical protein
MKEELGLIKVKLKDRGASKQMKNFKTDVPYAQVPLQNDQISNFKFRNSCADVGIKPWM